jgi:hypothetical protein
MIIMAGMAGDPGPVAGSQIIDRRWVNHINQAVPMVDTL